MVNHAFFVLENTGGFYRGEDVTSSSYRTFKDDETMYILDAKDLTVESVVCADLKKNKQFLRCLKQKYVFSGNGLFRVKLNGFSAYNFNAEVPVNGVLHLVAYNYGVSDKCFGIDGRHCGLYVSRSTKNSKDAFNESLWYADGFQRCELARVVGSRGISVIFACLYRSGRYLIAKYQVGIQARNSWIPVVLVYDIETGAFMGHHFYADISTDFTEIAPDRDIKELSKLVLRRW